MIKILDKNESYSIKEVIEKNFTDLKTDMRAGFLEVKVDVKDVRTTADSGLKSATAANLRLDRYDKHFLIIWVALVGSAFKMIAEYFN